jgi:hypothetical protein
MFALGLYKTEGLLLCPIAVIIFKQGKVEAVEKVTKDGTATYEVGCTLKSF